MGVFFLFVIITVVVIILVLKNKKAKQVEEDSTRHSYSKNTQRDDSETYFSRGCENKNNGDLTAAIENFTKAIELDPDYGLAYKARADAYKKRGDHDLAIADLAQHMKLLDGALKILEQFDADSDDENFD